MLFTNIGEVAQKVSDFISDLNGWCAPSHPGQVKTTVGEMLSVMGTRDTLAGRLFGREQCHRRRRPPALGEEDVGGGGAGDHSRW